MNDSRPILLVEDEPTSVELLDAAFRKAGLRRPLRVLTDGDQAVGYLSNEAPYGSREENPVPCLVLLDLMLPRRSGLEVLRWIRSQPRLRSLPVVMLTGSSHSRDIDEALRLGIQAYCVKPTDFDDLKKLARTIRRRVDGKDAQDSADVLSEADPGGRV